MTKQKQNNLTATKLRILLSLTLLLIVAGAAGGFMYVRGVLTSYSIEVSHKKVDADSSSGNIAALETIRKELIDDQDVIKKAEQLKSSSEFPEFDIVEDVTKYAAKNGLSISSFDFGDSSTAGPQPTAPSQGTTPATPSTASQKNVTISVTLKDPTNYEHLLQFLYDLDQNLPKLKVKGISLSSATTKSSNVITSQPIVIEMYTR